MTKEQADLIQAAIASDTAAWRVGSKNSANKKAEADKRDDAYRAFKELRESLGV